jgi:hypothetical protein
VLGWLVRRRLGGYLARRWWREATYIAFAATIAVAAAGVLVLGLPGAPAMVMLLAGGTLGCSVYLAILAVLGVISVRPSRH